VKRNTQKKPHIHSHLLFSLVNRLAALLNSLPLELLHDMHIALRFESLFVEAGSDLGTMWSAVLALPPQIQQT